jgi:hypothetical protein
MRLTKKNQFVSLKMTDDTAQLSIFRDSALHDFSTQVANQTKVGIFYSNFVVYSPQGEEITAQMNI